MSEGVPERRTSLFSRACLIRSHLRPIQRLSADELLKTKWIASVRKVPITTLKDLILRYDAWVKGGGTRMSMAAPLPWEEEEERERGCVLKWRCFVGFSHPAIDCSRTSILTTKTPGSSIQNEDIPFPTSVTSSPTTPCLPFSRTNLPADSRQFVRPLFPMSRPHCETSSITATSLPLSRFACRRLKCPPTISWPILRSTSLHVAEVRRGT